MVANSNTDDWDGVSFIISSGYRKAVIKQLAVGPATPSQIADNAGISISHVSRALGRLRERSSVELLVSEDRRKGRVYGITDQGADQWEMVKELDGDEKEVMTDGGVQLGESQRAQETVDGHVPRDEEIHTRQTDLFRRIMMLVGSFGGAIVAMTPIAAHLAGAMAFELAVLFQVGFIAMCVSMGLSGVMLRD